MVSARVAAGEDLYRLDEGALAELDADVVLTQDLCAVCAVDLDRVDDALGYLGCSARVLTLDPQSLDGVLASVLDVGDALGRARAGRRIRRLVARASRRARANARRRRRVDPSSSSSGPTHRSAPGTGCPTSSTAGGGIAVLAMPGGDSRRITWDAVRSAPADVVLVAPCGYHLEQAAAFAEQLVVDDRLPAGAEVWAVDADSHFVRPGPRLVDGAETVAQILHPAVVGAPSPDRASSGGRWPRSGRTARLLRELQDRRRALGCGRALHDRLDPVRPWSRRCRSGWP